MPLLRKLKEMEVGSTSHHQQSNRDPVLLQSPAGGSVHPQSIESQPYSTLKSPTHPKSLDPGTIKCFILHDARRLYWWTGDEEDEVDDVVAEEEEDFVMDEASQKSIWEGIKCKEPLLMERLTKHCEDRKEDYYVHPPPLEMLAYPGWYVGLFDLLLMM